MIIIIANIKYGLTYYNTFTMGVCSNYHGYFFQCTETVCQAFYALLKHLSPEGDYLTPEGHYFAH